MNGLVWIVVSRGPRCSDAPLSFVLGPSYSEDVSSRSRCSYVLRGAFRLGAESLLDCVESVVSLARTDRWTVL